MEIYQEVETDVPGTPTRHHKRRFGSPLTSKRSGRTPLKPHNYQSPYQRSTSSSAHSPMQEVRRSIKDTTNNMSAIHNDKVNDVDAGLAKKSSFSSGIVHPKATSKATSTGVSSRVKWKQTYSQSPSENSSTANKKKSNQHTKPITPSTQSATTNSLRRSIRSTMSPPATRPSSTNKGADTAKPTTIHLKMSERKLGQPKNTGAGVSTGLSSRRHKLLGGDGSSVISSKIGPPQRMLPRTPNSLLRTELDTTAYDEDESLLVSPPGALWNVLTTSTTSLVVVSPAAAAALNPSSSNRRKQKGVELKGSPQPQSSPTLQPRTLLTSPDGVKHSRQDNQHEKNLPSPNSQAATKLAQSIQKAKFVAKYQKTSLNDKIRPSPLGQSSESPISSRENGEITMPQATEHDTVMTLENSLKSSPSTLRESVETLPIVKSRLNCKDRPTLRPNLSIVRKSMPKNHTEASPKDMNDISTTEGTEEARINGNMFFVELPNSSSNMNGTASQVRGDVAAEAMDFSNLFRNNSAVTKKGKELNPGQGEIDQMTPVARDEQPRPSGGSSNGNAIAFEIPFLDTRDPTQRNPRPVKTSATSLHEKQEQPKQKNVNPWAESQCDTFACWLNYTLAPTEDDSQTDLGVPSGSSESNGLKTLYLYRRLAQSRMKGSDLFRSAGMSDIRKKIFDEIVKGRLALRSDRDIYADLSLRKQIISLLLSYTTPWLRLGLEVIFGEVFSFEIPLNEDFAATKYETSKRGQGKSGSQMRFRLQSFITHRVLSDATVLSKYTKGRCKVPSGKFEKEYRAEMRDLVLYRLMLLIFYLDRAKESNILDKVPRLFTKSSTVKSSSQVLLALCRDFLSSEGNFIKHLSRIGLSVSYKQDRLDEVEFHVSNLAVDLRDGVRLTRMAEVVTEVPPKSLMRSLRLPAVSRLQKLHNAGVAMTSLKQFGVEIADDIHTHHIVDGHREIVLKLMWSVIAHCCMHKLLLKDQVEQEILNVIRSNQARRKVEGRPAAQNPDSEADQTSLDDLSPIAVLKSLLFRWCHAVCSCFDYEVTDLTKSFADGKAFCYLVHYYHPSVIKLEEVLPTSNELSSETIVSNARKNATMASKRVSDLGGIPNMIPITDPENPPDEKCTLVCLAYLCSRLAESSKEILASILIQAYYRNYRKRGAARKIFDAWLRNKNAYYEARKRRFAQAVWMIEEFVSARQGALARLRQIRLAKELRCDSSVIIQKSARRFLSRLRFNRIKENFLAASRIQLQWRCYIAKQKYIVRVLRRDSAILIQRVWRGYDTRLDMKYTYNTAVQLQRFMRGFLAKLELQRRHTAAAVIQKAWWNHSARLAREKSATIIQCAWRRHLARTEGAVRMLYRDAACELQRFWRGSYCRMLFELSIQSAIMIQKIVRGRAARRYIDLALCRRSATLIQSIWRSFSEQVSFQFHLLDIVSIQSLIRRHIARTQLRKKIYAIRTLQQEFRRNLALRILSEKRQEREIACQQHFAAVVVQCALRVWLSRQKFSCLQMCRRCSTLIQSSWRRFSQARAFAEVIRATLVIQSLHRGRSVRRETVLRAEAAVCLQKEWRRFWAQSNYNLDLLEIMIVQSAVRRRRAIKESLRRRSAILVLQRSVRRHQASDCASQRLSAVVTLQAACRMILAISCASRRLNAIIAIQAAARGRHAVNSSSRRMRAILVLQCFVRKTHAKVSASRKLDAVLCIQASIRKRLAAIHVSNRRHAVLTIQGLIRVRNSMEYAMHKKGAILVIQSWARRRLALQKVRFLRDIKLQDEAMQNAAIFCQSCVRRCVAISESRRRLSLILFLQARWRSREARRRYQTVRSATITLQSMLRGWHIRHDLSIRGDAAITIQNSWRCFSTFVRYHLARGDITIVQSIVRRHLAQRVVERRIYLIHCVQKICRGYFGRRRFLNYRTSAEKIQTIYRGFAARRSYRKNLVVIVAFQSIVRRWLSLRIAQGRIFSCRALQSVVRGWLARQSFEKKLSDRARHNVEMNACVTIQRLWRGRVSRVVFKRHTAARAIQKTWRCFDAHVDYLLKVIDIIMIQSHLRSFVTKIRFQKTIRGIVALQSVVRGTSRRIMLKRVIGGFVKLQSVIRARLAVVQLKRYRLASITIQRYARGYKARDELAIVNFAASDIQRIWRGYIEFVDYAMMLLAANKLQSFFRMVLAVQSSKRIRLENRVERSYIYKKAGVIQRAFRNYRYRMKELHAILTVQCAFRDFLSRRRYLRILSGVTRLQATFRAEKIRRDISKDIANVARKIYRANVRAQDDPKMRLGFRTNAALEVLKTSTSLSELMRAVDALETSTRLSAVCCEVFTEANAADILLGLIRTCNRSLPHIQLMQNVLLTLDNVSKHAVLLPSFANPDSAEVFMDLSQVFRDKDGIFCLSVTLLGRIFRCNMDVKALCSTRENLKRITSVHVLCSQKMRAVPKCKLSKEHKRSLVSRRTEFDRRTGLKALQQIIKMIEDDDQAMMNTQSKTFKF